ncbi:MFS transporter [Tumebacillus algifaecis]|uniref:MFS transporter n=1 Tax=Tumebacillus algifaecis TaxID=1214604 RepID=A0A223CY21_9BACL|nr:MDR family MFS transporter [Tumebacillus algifaecis]ASS74057.1 MFS transporter [Tumebacillus algifaecis]
MTTAQTVEPTDLTQPSRKRTLVIIGLMLGLFFASLDQTVVGTAMPTIIGQLGGIELLTWITTAYLLTSTAVVPIAGKLADLFGRRVIYMIGMGIFIIGSALCGMAESMTQLAVYRAIQGLGGGILMPLAMTIIGDITTGESRAKMQGMFMAVFGLSSLAGPQAGGWIVDHWHWNWIFYINLPFGLLAMVFIALGLKNVHVKKEVIIDWAGIGTLIVGIVSLLLALSFGGNKYAWDSVEILGLFGLAVVSLVSFVFVELRAKDPVIPMGLFKNSVFTSVNIIGFLMSLGMFGAMMFIPLFMQGVVGMSPSQTASVMTPMMLGSMVASIIGSRLLLKIGLRPQLIIGMGIMLIGFILFLTLGLETTQLRASLYMIIMGAGMGMIMPSLGIAVQEAFPAEIRGTVTSATTFFRSIGGTVGIAVLGTLFNSKSIEMIGTKLDMTLQSFGPQGEQLLDMAHNSPQGLYSSLLSDTFLNGLPQEVAGMFSTQVVPVLKDALLTSIHSVFSIAVWFLAAGLVAAFFVGKVKISGAKAKPTKAEETIKAEEAVQS